MVSFKTIAEHFKFDDPSIAVDQRAQRRIRESRIPQLSNYIIQNPDNYVFSSITVSVGGKMTFHPTPGLGDLGKDSLPELPDEKKARLMNDFGLSIYDASIVISDQDISEYYEEVAKNSDYKLAANWMIVELFGVLNKEGKEIKDSPVSAKNLSKLINLIKDNTFSVKIAKTVFEEMVKNDQDPDKIVEDKGLKQQSDPKELEKIIETIVKNNQDKVEQYKSGKDKLFGFFVGQAMKETEGKGNPKLINDILKEKLK